MHASTTESFSYSPGLFKGHTRALPTTRSNYMRKFTEIVLLRLSNYQDDVGLSDILHRKKTLVVQETVDIVRLCNTNILTLKSLRCTATSRTGWQGVNPEPSAALTLPAQHPILISALLARLSGRLSLPLPLFYLALVVKADLNNLVRDGLVEGRVAESSLLEEVALGRRDQVIELSPGDGGEHGLEGPVEATGRVAVVVVDRDHLIGADEDLAEVAVDVALDQSLLGLHLEVLDGVVNVDSVLDIARGDLDLEELALLDSVDFAEDDLEAFKGRAFGVNAIDDVGWSVGNLVANEGAVCLHAVAVVDTDEPDRSTGTVRAVPCLDGRHGFLVV
jgi:hypothetical protein